MKVDQPERGNPACTSLLDLPPQVLSHISGLVLGPRKRRLRLTCKPLHAIATPQHVRLDVGWAANRRPDDQLRLRRLAQAWTTAHTADVLYRQAPGERPGTEPAAGQSMWHQIVEEAIQQHDVSGEAADIDGTLHTAAVTAATAGITRWGIDGELPSSLSHWTQLTSVKAACTSTVLLAQHCSQLQALTLTRPYYISRITCERELPRAMQCLSTFCHLTCLVIRDLNLDRLPSPLAQSLPQLRSLSLSGEVSADISPIISGLKQLSQLELWSDFTSDFFSDFPEFADPAAVFSPCDLPALQSLTFHAGDLDVLSTGVTMATMFGSCTALTSLKCSGMGSGEMSHWPHLVHLQVENWRFANCHVSSAGFNSLTFLEVGTLELIHPCTGFLPSLLTLKVKQLVCNVQLSEFAPQLQQLMIQCFSHREHLACLSGHPTLACLNLPYRMLIGATPTQLNAVKTENRDGPSLTQSFRQSLTGPESVSQSCPGQSLTGQESASQSCLGQSLTGPESVSQSCPGQSIRAQTPHKALLSLPALTRLQVYAFDFVLTASDIQMMRMCAQDPGGLASMAMHSVRELEVVVVDCGLPGHCWSLFPVMLALLPGLRRVHASAQQRWGSAYQNPGDGGSSAGLLGAGSANMPISRAVISMPQTQPSQSGVWRGVGYALSVLQHLEVLELSPVFFLGNQDKGRHDAGLHVMSRVFGNPNIDYFASKADVGAKGVERCLTVLLALLAGSCSLRHVYLLEHELYAGCADRCEDVINAQDEALRMVSEQVEAAQAELADAKFQVEWK